jgi:hypothetical protein
VESGLAAPPQTPKAAVSRAVARLTGRGPVDAAGADINRLDLSLAIGKTAGFRLKPGRCCEKNDVITSLLHEAMNAETEERHAQARWRKK